MRKQIAAVIVLAVLACAKQSRSEMVSSHAPAEFLGVASATGVNGTLWRTRLVVANPDPNQPTGIVLWLRGGGVDVERDFVLPAGEIVVFDDVLQELFAVSGVFALEVGVSAYPADVSCVTYAETECGERFSLPLPAKLIDFGYRDHLPFRIPQGGRANFYILNLSESTVRIDWTISRQDGSVLKTGITFLGPKEGRQEALFPGLPPDASLIFAYRHNYNSDGTLMGYVSVVDEEANHSYISPFLARWY